MTTLDTLVARAVHAARLLERAVHDPGPWAMEYAGQVFPADRVIHADHVHIVATMPAQCWLGDPESPLSLLIDGEVVAVRRIPHPGDSAADLDWTIGARTGALSA